jgi:glutaconate CoA-transferase subunit A
MESGRVRISENSNYSLALRVKAAAMGVPFLPARDLMGTDTLEKSPSLQVACPFTGKPVVLHPAIWPDVAAIHVHEADVYGNCRIRGISVSDLDLARAARRLVITCERLVPTEEIRRNPDATGIPYYLVDAVCEVPYGGFPGCMAYEYYSDEEHLREWLDAERDVETFKAFLERNIYGVSEFAQYLERNGGRKRMTELRRKELLLPAEGGSKG